MTVNIGTAINAERNFSEVKSHEAGRPTPGGAAMTLEEKERELKEAMKKRESLSTIRVEESTTLAIPAGPNRTNYKKKGYELQLRLPEPLTTENIEDFITQAENLLEQHIKNFEKKHLEEQSEGQNKPDPPVPAKSTPTSNTVLAPLKVNNEGWKDWKSGKPGESKISHLDPEFADFLEKSSYFYPKRWKAPDGFEYWLSRTDDGTLFIHRVGGKK